MPYSEEEEEICLEPIENNYYTETEYEEPCQRLAAALLRYREYLRWAVEYYDDIEGFFEQARETALTETGIDIADDQQIQQLVCQLDGMQYPMCFL